jgi:hypothetical protein
MKTADLGEWIEVLTERAAATEGEWTALLLSGDTEGARVERRSGRLAAVNAISALQSLQDARRAMS